MRAVAYPLLLPRLRPNRDWLPGLVGQCVKRVDHQAGSQPHLAALFPLFEVSYVSLLVEQVFIPIGRRSLLFSYPHAQPRSTSYAARSLAAHPAARSSLYVRDVLACLIILAATPQQTNALPRPSAVFCAPPQTLRRPRGKGRPGSLYTPHRRRSLIFLYL